MDPGTTPHTKFEFKSSKAAPVRTESMAGACDVPGDASEMHKQQQQQQQHRQQQQHPQPGYWQPRCINPDDEWYTSFTYLMVCAAVFSAWLAPFAMAFAPFPGMFPAKSVLFVLEALLTALFVLDILSKCVVSCDDPATGTPITEPWPAFKQYLKGMFAWDVLFTVPWDSVILVAMGETESNDRQALLIGMLKLLQLGRLYRVAAFMEMAEYKMLVPQAVMVLTRNIAYLLFSSHVFGCIFYTIARIEEFERESWVGRHIGRWDGQPTWVRYMYTLYYGVMIFGSVGDNDFYTATAVEALVMVVYVCTNILLGAYILGTVTMLMVKGEKRLKVFRERITTLRRYGKDHELPPTLMEAMEEQLELHFHSEQSSDDKVLAIYPATIRRSVLRQLYLAPIKACPLTVGCKAKFLDKMLTAGKVETFLPKSQIIQRGDVVDEIYIILQGEVLATLDDASLTVNSSERKKKMRKSKSIGGVADLSKRSFAAQRSLKSQSVRSHAAGGVAEAVEIRADDSHRLTIDQGGPRGPKGGDAWTRPDPRPQRISDAGSCGGSSFGGSDARSGSPLPASRTLNEKFSSSARREGGKSRYLGESDAFGEVSFFTEMTSHESVWSSSVVKVMSLSRSVYGELLASFPHETRRMLENLERVSQDAVRVELLLALDGGAAALSEEAGAAMEQLRSGDLQPSNLTPSVMAEVSRLLMGYQQDMLDNLSKVKEALAKYTLKVDQSITYEFLNSCSGGDVTAIKAALSSGMSPNAADYDNRSGLMLACHEGHLSIVQMLLSAGADPMLMDNFGATAMWEAVTMGHDDIIQVMCAFQGSLGMDGSVIAAHMGLMVNDGNVVQLRRMLLAGADPDMAIVEYRGITPLHVAASTGNLAVANVLVKEGKAKVNLKDAWGLTPLDEAKRQGNQPMVDFLSKFSDTRMESGLEAKMEFLNHCSDGNLAQVKSAMALGMSPDTADYDVRTGLMLACHADQEGVVRALLAAGADPLVKDAFGNTAMWECVIMGLPHLIDLLLQYGGSLGMQDILCSFQMSSMVIEDDLLKLRMMMRAGISPDQPDCLKITPLHTACSLGNYMAMRLLVEEANATVDVLDCHGRTPLDCAQQLGHFHVLMYLEPLTLAAQQGRIRNRACSMLPPASSLLMGKGLPPIEVKRPPSMRASGSNVDEVEHQDMDGEEEDDGAVGSIVPPFVPSISKVKVLKPESGLACEEEARREEELNNWLDMDPAKPTDGLTKPQVAGIPQLPPLRMTVLPLATSATLQASTSPRPLPWSCGAEDPGLELLLEDVASPRVIDNDPGVLTPRPRPVSGPRLCGGASGAPDPFHDAQSTKRSASSASGVCPGSTLNVNSCEQ